MDTSVFVSAADSRSGASWRCLVLFAARQFRLAATTEILAEYESTAEGVFRVSGGRRRMDWPPLLDWIAREAVLVAPAPLGKQRSRDASDDIFLACALSSGANYIVSYDKDLLSLGKPFGIEILTPAAFLAKFERHQP